MDVKKPYAKLEIFIFSQLASKSNLFENNKLHETLNMGINHLDTAHLYLRGNSERVIGEVLQRSGKRDKVYVATKMRFARDNEEMR